MVAEKGKEEMGKTTNVGGKTMDMVSITKAIELIEKDMQRAMGELAELKKQVSSSVNEKENFKKKVKKVNRVVGWLTRRPGADARESGFMIGDLVEISNIVKFKKTKKKINGSDVTGLVKKITKRFIVVKCVNPEGIEEDIDREPQHVCFIERRE